MRNSTHHAFSQYAVPLLTLAIAVAALLGSSEAVLATNHLAPGGAAGLPSDAEIDAQNARFGDAWQSTSAKETPPDGLSGTSQKPMEVLQSTGPEAEVSQQTGGGTETKLDNPLVVDDLAKFIQLVIGGLVKVGYLVGVCFIVYAGFLFVTSGENSSNLGKAKQTLFWTVIGLGILLGAQAIAVIIMETIKEISKAAS
jgi:hypothetical protein